MKTTFVTRLDTLERRLPPPDYTPAWFYDLFDWLLSALAATVGQARPGEGVGPGLNRALDTLAPLQAGEEPLGMERLARALDELAAGLGLDPENPPPRDLLDRAERQLRAAPDSFVRERALDLTAQLRRRWPEEFGP